MIPVEFEDAGIDIIGDDYAIGQDRRGKGRGLTADQRRCGEVDLTNGLHRQARGTGEVFAQQKLASGRAVIVIKNLGFFVIEIEAEVVGTRLVCAEGEALCRNHRDKDPIVVSRDERRILCQVGSVGQIIPVDAVFDIIAVLLVDPVLAAFFSDSGIGSIVVGGASRDGLFNIIDADRAGNKLCLGCGKCCQRADIFGIVFFR